VISNLALDNKLKSVYSTNAASLARISQLEAENAKNSARLADLELVNSTFQQRIENERKHAGDQYRALREKYDKELEARKLLEERLKALEVTQARRQRSQNRGRGRVNGFFHGHQNGNVNANFNFNPNRPQESAPNTAAANFPRRTSRVPLPVRPSTPIRPVFNKEPGSSSSTLVSSTHSTFSQNSLQTNDSFSSVDSMTVRSSSPGTPTVTKAAPSSITEMGSPVLPVLENGKLIPEAEKRRSLYVSKPSWANMVARTGSNV
jgi:hypothetical protein